MTLAPAGAMMRKGDLLIDFAVNRNGTRNIFLNTPNQAAWFERYVGGTDDMDYATLVARAGLRLVRERDEGNHRWMLEKALGDAKESTAQERAFLNGVFSAGGFGKGEFVQFAAMRTAKAAATKSSASRCAQISWRAAMG